MNAIFVLLSLIGTIASCTISPSRVNNLSTLPEGLYTGNQLFIIAYVQVRGDMIIADLIYKDKFPRDFLTDTLYYNGTNNSWKGKITNLYQKKISWYINTKNPPVFESTIKLKANEKQYKEYFNRHKNLALLRKTYIAYIEQSTNKVEATEMFEQIVKSFDLNAKANKLHYEAFLKEYENFKAKLN